MNDETAAILVVDDNTTTRYVVSSWLRRGGHRVTEAATGSEALRLIATEPVDLVLLDIGLPDVSGYEVCERIKADPRTQSLPVVHLSATAVQVSDRTEGLARGADAYLTEPVDPGEMLATVQAVLRYFRARQRAEDLASRLARLAEATLTVNRASTFPELLQRAATGAAGIFGRAAAVVATTPDGEPLIASCATPGARPDIRPWSDALGRLGADDGLSTVLRTEDAATWPELGAAAEGSNVWVGVSRTKRERPPVRVVVPADRLGDDDVNVLTQFGQAVALAVEAMRSYDEERRIALTLQKSLLPRGLPTIDGVDLAVRYVPASKHAEIGGDFYEVLTIDGVLVVAIGDVAGHSLHAATVMGELRHVLRAYLSEGHSPSEVVRQLNDLMLQLLPEETATLCLIELDLRTGRLRLANAGHLPPVLSAPGSGARLLETGWPMLGLEVPHGPEIDEELPPGGTIVLVTDGLIERRGVSIWDALLRLRQAVEVVEPDLEAFCDRLLGEFVTGPTDDDVAIVAMRRAPIERPDE